MSRFSGALSRTPVQRVIRLRTRRRLAVLCYHDVPDADLFRRHAELIARTRVPISLQHAIAAIRWGARLPAGATLVTFDDADPTVLENAAPVMRDLGIPGVVFAIAELVGSVRATWWTEATALVEAGARAPSLPRGDAGLALTRLKAMSDSNRRRTLEDLRHSAPEARPASRQLTAHELRELDHAGLSVQSHTLSHPLLPRCDELTIEHEIRSAQDLLGDALGRRPVALAYPNGLWDARTVRACAQSALDVCFQLDHRHTATPASSPYAASRLRIDARDDPTTLAVVMSGLAPWMSHLRHGRSAAPSPDVSLDPPSRTLRAIRSAHRDFDPSPKRSERSAGDQ